MTKFVVGGLIIVAALAFLIFSSFQSSAIYYMTISEVLAESDSLVDKEVRINGVVDKSTIDWNAQDLVLRFDVVEGEQRLPVVYHDVVPDTFAQSESVVLEGKLGNDGVFQANNLLVKCPSKYEAEPGQ
ncbi:MAG: cytochrome c maturation protein CcmE [Anaerolineae bacterium]